MGSPKGGIWCSDNSGLVFVARAEDVVLWDLKKAEIVREFKVSTNIFGTLSAIRSFPRFCKMISESSTVVICSFPATQAIKETSQIIVYKTCETA